jgi:hypothetical protein
VYLPNYARDELNCTLNRVKEHGVEDSGFLLELVEGDRNPLYKATELETQKLAELNGGE